MANFLVIEDNPTVMKAHLFLLKSLDHTAAGAETGEDGLAALLAMPGVDMVFLDYRLPGMNGYEVSRRIREEPVYAAYSGVPIIGIGAFPVEERAYLTYYFEKSQDFVRDVYDVLDRYLPKQ